MKRALTIVAVLAVAPLLLAIPPVAAGRANDSKSAVIVFSGQGNDLDAYTGAPPFKHQTVIKTRASDPKGLDLNAQICFFPDNKRFIAGEDTGQPDPLQGWGIFKISGTKIGKLKTREIGKLQPTYQGAADNAENYGCGILSDGRVVTTDIGNQASGPPDGQLIIWFPPFTKGFDTVPEGHNGTVAYCKLDIAIGTAGAITIDKDDNVYVPSARGEGVYRYSGPFPTAADAAGGCDSTDGTGAPMASATSINKSVFIAAGANDLATPNAIVAKPNADGEAGGWYVTSVINGVINEYTADGEFVRTILRPPAGETLGAQPFSTGTPLGIGVAPDGTIYYADIGIVIDGANIGPGDNTGTVRRITFKGGEPQPPETMATGLAFPDGIGVWVPRR